MFKAPKELCTISVKHRILVYYDYDPPVSKMRWNTVCNFSWCVVAHFPKLFSPLVTLPSIRISFLQVSLILNKCSKISLFKKYFSIFLSLISLSKFYAISLSLALFLFVFPFLIV